MVTEAGKELLRNTINTAKFHNRILEENEMWKQWELECGLTMMVSDDDIIKRIKKNHQCSKHRRRDKSRSRDSFRNKHETAKSRQGAGSSNDRWDHSGFAELYPDATVPDKFPSTSSVSSLDRHKKKKKKSRHRSDSSDEEIWEEFKRPAQMWNKENTLKLIDLLRDAPALWNINYPGYREQHVKLKELKRIASKFCVHEDEITTQIAFLMKEFHEEHKKMTLKNINGSYAKFSENEWFAYKHMTFLTNNKNQRNCKTVKNNLRKEENPQWFDSSDSYSDSEEETYEPLAKQSSCCIKGKVRDEKKDYYEKKASYSDSDDGTYQPSAKQSSYCVKSKVRDEKRDDYEKKASYSDSDDGTYRPSAKQSIHCMKSKVRDEKMDEHGKKACTNLPYVQAYMAQKDSFSVYGEIVAHRMREGKKSSKAVARAEREIDLILLKFEKGYFDAPEDTFK